MSEMTSFKYWDFYDVPRLILLRYGGCSFLLCCWFDDDLDDYGDRYEIYKPSDSDLVVLREDGWEPFISRALKRVGDVPVSALKFDSTHRSELDASCLKSFLVEQ